MGEKAIRETYLLTMLSLLEISGYELFHVVTTVCFSPGLLSILGTRAEHSERELEKDGGFSG